jgi:glutamate 5-kinase
MTQFIERADVVKLGGSTVTVHEKGQPPRLDEEKFAAIVDEISRSDTPTVVVNSLAIAMAMNKIGLADRPDPKTKKGMVQLQRLASIGNRLVLNRLDDATPADREIGELLLTGPDLDRKAAESQRPEVITVINTMLEESDIPAANESDAVTHKEISFGSNDILAAQLAALMKGSELFGEVRLFLLTDVNGVYRDVNDPNSRIPVIEGPEKFRDVAGGPASAFSIGGMESKFDAAMITRHAGIPMWVYDPGDGPQEAAVAGEIGTYFPIWTPHNS